MKNQQTQQGYILVLTMLIVSLIVSLTTYIAYRTTMFVPYAKIAASQQKARMLAYNGLQLAISQLSTFEPSSQEKEGEADKQKQQIQTSSPPTTGKKSGTDATEIARQLLQHILPSLNNSQTISLKKKIDGIEGDIQIIISCEQGKFDINMLYDFDKHRFIDEKDTPLSEEEQKRSIRALFKSIFDQVQKRMGEPNLFESFENFLKQRQYKLDDVTELLTVPEFSVFKNYTFDIIPAIQLSEKKAWQPFFLTDLFTIYSGRKSIEPWLLSRGVQDIVGVQGISVDNREKEEGKAAVIKELLQKFSLSTDWKKQWDIVFAPLYKKEYSALPPFVTSLLSTKFEPTIFSVVSYGTFANVTQRLYAILERTIEHKKDTVVIQTNIKKIYWL